MQNVRLQICTGLFRSASNVQVFENMLALLAKNARAQGPAGTVPPMQVRAAAAAQSLPAPAPAANPQLPAGEIPRVTAQVRTVMTTSGRTRPPQPPAAEDGAAPQPQQPEPPQQQG